VSGHHHDLIDIETHFEQLISTLKQAGIALNGLFLNLDSGFDAENLRTKSASMDIIVNIAHNKRNSGAYNNHYFDEELYKERYAIERTNAWLDSFRSLLNRFDTTITSWMGFNYLAFCVIGIKKFNKNNKSR
jgi:transposase